MAFHAYIIEKLWMIPDENRNAHGYESYGITITEEAAEAFCAAGKTFTQKDCWSLYDPMPEYRYKRVPILTT